MRNGKWIVIALVILSACSKEKNDSQIDSSVLTGKWQLIEQLSDPGDGSGVFVPVTSNKTIEFFSNETWTSNGLMCVMTESSSENSSGTYSAADSTITVNGCSSNPRPISYELVDAHLILNFPCIEPCRQKYSKIQ